MGWDFGPLGWGKKQLGKKIVLMRVGGVGQNGERELRCRIVEIEVGMNQTCETIGTGMVAVLGLLWGGVSLEGAEKVVVPWSFGALKRPVLPVVEGAWQEMDRFVMERLMKEGGKLGEAAERATWMWRGRCTLGFSCEGDEGSCY
jgi:hypothetical protein